MGRDSSMPNSPVVMAASLNFAGWPSTEAKLSGRLAVAVNVLRWPLTIKAFRPEHRCAAFGSAKYSGNHLR